MCSRATLAPGDDVRLADAARRVEDWRQVLVVGAFHKAVPLLWAHLQSEVPAGIAEVLKTHARTRAMSVLFLEGEAARIARRFDADGIPFLTFKGPSLSEAYGGVALRPFVDNDLLISPDRFDDAERALLALGFNERKRSDVQQAVYLRVHGEYTFGRMVGQQISTVDLHTRLVPVAYAYREPFDALRARTRRVQMAGELLPAMGWNDLFVALSVNALKDQWDRLRLATDVAEVAALVDDWRAVADRAAASRCTRALHLAVLVSEQTVRASYPSWLLDRALADQRAGRLAGLVIERLPRAHEEPVMSGPKRARFNALAPDGLRGQARYLGYVALRRALSRVMTPHATPPPNP